MNQDCFTKISAFFLFLKKCWGGLSPSPPSSPFVQGPEHSGKTWKIREKFEKFAKSGKNRQTQGNSESRNTCGKIRENFSTSVQPVDTITLCGCGKVKHELRVMSFEVQVQIHELRVQIHELED